MKTTITPKPQGSDTPETDGLSHYEMSEWLRDKFRTLERSRNALAAERDSLRAELQKVCDHEWEHIDDSFDHEFGIEQIHSCVCEKCGATKPYEPETFGDEVI